MRWWYEEGYFVITAACRTICSKSHRNSWTVQPTYLSSGQPLFAWFHPKPSLSYKTTCMEVDIQCFVPFNASLLLQIVCSLFIENELPQDTNLQRITLYRCIIFKLSLLLSPVIHPPLSWFSELQSFQRPLVYSFYSRSINRVFWKSRSIVFTGISCGN